MKKIKSIASVLCLIVFSAFLFAGCGENKDIVALRNDFSALNLNNYFGYEQTVTIKNGATEYQSYAKTISYDGQNIKVYEKETTLNDLNSNEYSTTNETTYYVVDGYKYEVVNGSYTKTDKISVSLSFGLKFKEEYFKVFTVQQDNVTKIFEATIMGNSYNAFLNKEIEDVNNMTFKVITKSNKLNLCVVEYLKNDGTKVTMKTNFYTKAQIVELP